jgi:tetratricopeptide (TPR) repeat protein
MQARYLLTSVLLLFIAHLLGAQPQDLLNRAEGLREKGAFQASNQLLNRFLAEYPEREYDIGDVYYQKSLNYYGLGQLDKALAANEQSSEIRLNFGSEDLGKNYLHRGRTQLGMLQLVDALESLQQADEFPFIDDPLLPAEVQRLMGEVYAAAGKHGLAVQYYDTALENLSILVGDEGPAFRNLLLQKAQLLQYTDAESAGEILEGLIRKSPKAIFYQARGDLYRALEDWGAAIGQYQQAYTRVEPKEEVLKAELLLRLGQVSMQQGQPSDNYTQQCIKRLCPGLDVDENPLPPIGQHILDTLLMIEALELKAAEHLQQYQDQAQDTALVIAETAARLGIKLFEKKASSYGDYRLRERQVLPLLSIFDPLLYSLSKQGRDKEVFRYVDRVAQWRWRLTDMLEWVSELEVDTVQSRIPEGTLLLSYHYSADYCILSAMNGVEATTVVIPSVDTAGLTLAEAVTQFRQSLAKEDPDAFVRLGHQLYEWLLAPVPDWLGGASYVQIYRDGALEKLPFEALLTELPNKRKREKYHRMDFLGEEFALAYSSRPADVKKDGQLQLSNALAVMPSFEEEAGRLNALNQLKATLWADDSVDEEGQLQLSSPELLVKGVAAELTGTEATEGRLVELLPNYDALLLAAPYVARQDSPSASAFVLAQDKASEEDGFWQLMEWGSTLSGKGLVVLDEPKPELARAAQIGGASAILFAEAQQQGLLESLIAEYPAIPLAEAAFELRKAMASKRKTAAPWQWGGLWVMQP